MPFSEEEKAPFDFAMLAREHADMRAALHDAGARIGMFASRFPSRQSSKKRIPLHR